MLVVGSYLALPADRERLGSLGNWLTSRVTEFAMNKAVEPVPKWAWLVQALRQAVSKSRPGWEGRVCVGIWGYLSGEHSLPHVGAVRRALRPELVPLPGHGYIECMGRSTRV